jgi:hypothetical protein
VLNPSSERKPTSLPKSTAVGVESTVTLLDPFVVPVFSIILSMVMLNATTDETGASSPVTNTADCVPLPAPLEVLPLPPPQPVKAINTIAQKISPKFFMPRSESVNFGGEFADLCMQTQKI